MSDTISTESPGTALAANSTAAGSITIRDLNESYAMLRGEAHLVNSDIENGHRQVRRYDLDDRTSVKARSAVSGLLDELATDRGLSWATIARLTGVSVSGVRKWRAGDAPKPEKRLALARLAAFLDLVGEMPVAEPGAWLSMPLVAGFSATGEDLYIAGNVDDLLDYAAGHVQPKEMLDRFDPEWRARYASDWEIVTADDGNRSIHRRTEKL
jgi:transcriptional regulator with XRE-family HTH domain